MSDAIDDFMALPRVQQLGTLQQLAPDKQDKLLAAVKQRRNNPTTPSPPTAPEPEARTPCNYAKESMFGLGRGLKSTVVGLGQTVAHPIKTVTDMRAQLKDADAASTKEWKDLGGDKQDS